MIEIKWKKLQVQRTMKIYIAGFLIYLYVTKNILFKLINSSIISLISNICQYFINIIN